jgi:Cytochrome P450
LSDLEIGGYHIPKGAVLIVNTYITHRHPDFWQAPETFQPERFLPENESKTDKWAYIPFGGGQRVCLGQSFALLEAVLLLATIASRFKLRLLPDHPIRQRAAITLYPENGLPMRVYKR